MRASIDLGTNSLRAIIVEDPSEPLNIIYEEGFIVRIGEGINKNRLINPEAKERTLSALRVIKSKFEQWGRGSEDYRFVATSALRDAKDSKAFIDEVAKIGLTMSIISGIEEANIIAKAIIAFVPERQNHALFIDQGGGSVEFIHPYKGKSRVKSLNIGVVRLTEMFFKIFPPSKKEVELLLDYLTKIVYKELQPIINAEPDQLIIIGGTGTTLAKAYLNLDSFDSLKIHGQIIPLSFVDDFLSRVLTLTPSEIAKKYQLDMRRADVITAGVIQIQCLLKVFRISEFLVSDRGLRYGLLLP